MKELRGDTITFAVEGDRTFEKGDIVRVGIKENIEADEYAIPLKIIEIDGTKEVLDIDIEYTEAEKLKSGKYKIEVELTTKSGIRKTIIQKDLTIESDVVR